jgi:hypothetical protein
VGTCIVAVQPGYLRCCGNDASGRRLASDGSHTPIRLYGMVLN